MYYNLIKTPALIKTGKNIISNIDALLRQAHLYFPSLILVTQQNLYEIYSDLISKNQFRDIIFCRGGTVEEAEGLIAKIKDTDSLVVAFGGGSILDLVKYSAGKCDLPYITVPSALSNDAIYSCVSRLSQDGKKKSFGVQPPIGIIVDLDIIRNSPEQLLLAGVGDLITNLSAIQDWKLAHKKIGEPINELAYMLAKEAASGIFEYSKEDIKTDEFLMDLTNGLISSGLSMIISGNTRGTSGAEHLISHAIDEYFPDKSTIHGVQAAWAFLMIEKHIRKSGKFYNKLSRFYDDIGLVDVIQNHIPWNENDFPSLIPFAKKIRPRYTIFNSML